MSPRQPPAAFADAPLASAPLPALALIGFGLLMPLIGAAGGLLVGQTPGGRALMTVLGASASCITVPAAMRLALPRADAGVHVALSIAGTFPLNVLVGIPLYLRLAGATG